MSNTSDELREKEKKVAEAAAQAQSTQKSGCLIGGIVFVILGGVFGSAVGEGGAFVILGVAVVIGILVAVSNKNKTNTAVVQTAQYVETVQEKRRRDMNEMVTSVRKTGFVFSKIVYNTTNTACLALDSTHEKFLVKDESSYNVLTYNQMVSYELCKDGSSIITGNASGALVGGLLFGTVGAVAGAAGSPKDVSKYCSEMYISIVDNNARRYRLYLITEQVLESSADYKVAIERAREMLSILSVIEANNAKSREKTTPSARIDPTEKLISHSSTDNTNRENNKSKIEELKELKELLESNLITKSEFEDLKKELLNRDSQSSIPAPAVDVGDSSAEKTYEVVLLSCGDNKVEIIKEIRNILEINLSDAKNLTDSTPTTLKDNLTKQAALAICSKLEAIGATIEIK